MGQSSLVCLSASGHCAYRQDLFIAVPLSRGSCEIDKVPAFLCDHPAESGICQLNIIHMKDKIGFWFALMISVVICSCTGEQTDQQKQEDNLLGIWLCTESPNGYKDCYYTFLNDGKMIRDYDPSTSATAIYTFNADAKTITSTLADSQETYQVVLLTSSNMQLVGGGFDAASWKFQKVNSVSFPELKVEDKEITIKVGETKKLNISGMGIQLVSMGYQAKEGFIDDTESNYVVLVDDNAMNITGQFVGKCKLYIGSKNGSIDIPVTVEPNFPLWEHRFIIDKVKTFNIEAELGDNGYSSKKVDGSGIIYYYFEGISDVVSSLKVRYDPQYMTFTIPLNQKDRVEKSLQEYGDYFNYKENIRVYYTFLKKWTLGLYSYSDHLEVQVQKGGYR